MTLFRIVLLARPTRPRSSEEVVVYGSSLQALAAVQGLLARGVAANAITLVRPNWGPDVQVPFEEMPMLDADSSPSADPAALAATTAVAGADPSPVRPESGNGSRPSSPGGSGGGLRDRSTGPLGDDRAETIVNAALAALGVKDRSDLTLVGVRGKAPPKKLPPASSSNNSMEPTPAPPSGSSEVGSVNGDSANGEATGDDAPENGNDNASGGEGGYGEFEGGSASPELRLEVGSPNGSVAESEAPRSDTHTLLTECVFEQDPLSLAAMAEAANKYSSKSAARRSATGGGGNGNGGERGGSGTRRSGAAGRGANAAAALADRPNVVEIPCGLLLSCHSLNVRPSLFAALNGCGLAFDGRLVVDPRTMATSDARILAGGDCTKFGRLYEAASYLHAWHHPGDVGDYLAEKVLDAIDPTRNATASPSEAAAAGASVGGSVAGGSVDGGSSVASKGSIASQFVPGSGASAVSMLPVWSRPRTVSCTLPGGLKYARSRTAAAASPKIEPTGNGVKLAPGLEAIATAMAAGRFLGADSFTKNGATASSASMVKLDGHGRIVELSYLGEGPLEARNWGNLVGLHSSFAGQCTAKHRNGEVQDWGAYFRDNWAHALFHDRAFGGSNGLIPLLRQRMRQDDAARDLVELMKRTLDSASRLGHGAVGGGSEGVQESLSGALAGAIGVSGEKVGPGATKRIETALFDWMSDNKNTLPVFKVPERKEPAT